MWSSRTGWDLTPTPWARELARARAENVRLLDLTESNPTRCGLEYDSHFVLGPLADEQDPFSLRYDPDPRGLHLAREAVSQYYGDHGAKVDPDQILLTTSTSEAYSFLFRLLCNPGDEILVAQPSYPLFDFLAQLDDVRLVPFPLFYDHGWWLDPAVVRQSVTARTRAVMIVHPNNPTGHFTRAQDRHILEQLCREREMALIVDEVFLDYGYPGGPKAESFARGEHPVPTFVLSGLSKIAALPQMKAAWLACFADREALERLEVISDTYLSVSTPIQRALPAWLRRRGVIREQVKARLTRNLAALDSILAEQVLLSRLSVEAGWYVILRVPNLEPGEEFALRLLRERQVVIHTGEFFGFSGRGWIVASLLTDEADFREGMRAIVAEFAQV
jgi:alanine-synthesizing transaminase